MRRNPPTLPLAGGFIAAILMLAVLPTSGEAQIPKKVKKTVTRAAEEQTLSEIDRLARDKVRCVFDDLECIRKAARGRGPDRR